MKCWMNKEIANAYCIGCDIANGDDRSVTTILKKHRNGTVEVLNITNDRSFMDDVRIISEQISLRF